MRKCDKPVEPHGVLSVTLWFDSDNSWEYTGPCSHDLITHTSSVLLNAQPLALFSLTVMAELTKCRLIANVLEKELKSTVLICPDFY